MISLEVNSHPRGYPYRFSVSMFLLVRATAYSVLVNEK